MYINKRILKKNHIPNTLNYNSKKIANYQQNFFDIKKKDNKSYNDNHELNIISDILLEKNNFLISLPKTFEEKFKILEQQPIEYFKSSNKEYDINDIDKHLYHGIRFQKHLEKLEGIFKDKAILAGNYQDNYYPYTDNCNNGEYISLTTIDSGIVYETFIKENISLIISSQCNAIKTIYLTYDEWDKIKDLSTNNRYSYAPFEYQVKERIPINYIKAIGVPAKYLKMINKNNLIDIYINDIIELMDKYNINLPIVDTSNYNSILFIKDNYQNNIKYIKTRKKINC